MGVSPLVETACDIMKEQRLRARRPNARALLVPVRALLGGRSSPTA
jgi:hypothetical protein